MSNSDIDVERTAHFTYIWTIENALVATIMCSPSFTVQEMDTTKWYLAIDWEISDVINLELSREDDDDDKPIDFEMTCEMSFLGVDGLPLIKKNMIKDGNCFYFTNFADYDVVFCRRRSEFLPHDELTVRCRLWRTGTQITRADTCFARTVLRSAGCNFIWAIRKFSTLQRGEERKLLVNTNFNDLIILKLFITEKDNDEYISLNIERIFNGSDDYLTVTISLLDTEGRVLESEVNSYTSDYLFEQFFEKKRLIESKQSLLPNDVLTLRCGIRKSYSDIVFEQIENYRYLSSMNLNVIATDSGEILRFEQDGVTSKFSSYIKAMKNLLDEGVLSDVSLRTNSKSFPAHKCILSARSPVFKAMFNGNMKEKTSKFVEISDIDDETMQRLLFYIYTDKTEELEWRDVADLYRAADKYELIELKKKCATFLQCNLSARNVCNILTIADMHNDQELRDAAEDFLTRQEAEFFTSDVIQTLKVENFKLYVEILEKSLIIAKKKHYIKSGSNA